ncbi:hypothetical protein DM860_011203 [Cuscuta australis]|uniref:Uncharacterized protein n=1 Tax=Cuscuta australis TaxID=267555 RepID=A0A328DP68_9ASTE|nr:hypothetical protein DM860_011203 [Cuscuta australis]
MRSSTTTKVLFQNGKGEQQKVSQRTPITTASDTAVLQPQKCTTVRHNVTHKEMNKEPKKSEKEKSPLINNMNHVQLSRAQIELLVDKVATGLCKNRADPDLLNTVLREKLDKSILVSNKDNNTRKDGTAAAAEEDEGGGPARRGSNVSSPLLCLSWCRQPKPRITSNAATSSRNTIVRLVLKTNVLLKAWGGG